MSFDYAILFLPLPTTTVPPQPPNWTPVVLAFFVTLFAWVLIK